MILDKHWWWTNERESIVPDGHPDAAFLAFAKGHELADNLARNYGIPIPGEDDIDDADPGGESVGGDNGDESKTGNEEPQQQPQEKAKPAPANKARAKAADKAGG